MTENVEARLAELGLDEDKSLVEKQKKGKKWMLRKAKGRENDASVEHD